MRVLRNIAPTSEQLKVVNDYTPGFAVIRGAAGSGKTSTALYRLRFLSGVWSRQRAREGSDAAVRVLVLTYNRTLRGYVEELAVQQARQVAGVELEVTTFGKWSRQLLGEPQILQDLQRETKLLDLGRPLGLDRGFLLDEIEYVLGRFLPSQLDAYLTVRRDGRGLSPRMEQALRQRLLDQVCRPYGEWKTANGLLDWNDLAVRMATEELAEYEVVIVDEAQDFSANQIRAVANQVAETHSTTFILDAVQRIYPRGFSSWREVGIDIPARNVFPLPGNFRNTREIAQFARGLVEGLELSDDGSLPDFEGCTRRGPKPIVATGQFARQMDFVIERIHHHVPEDESVAILHPKGGGYFRYTKRRLNEAGIKWVELTRQSEWPQGDENVGLITLHSAKGLEFDHVFIVGLNGDLMPHGPEEDDTQLDNHRRLVAMGIGRARNSTAVTYKPEEASSVVRYFANGTFDLVPL